MFRADEVIALALDEHPLFAGREISPDFMARKFNDAMDWAFRELLYANPEAFHGFQVVPDDEVDLEPEFIDLTRGGTLDWHTIDGIDYRTSASGKYAQQVVLAPIEARHRIITEYEHLDRPLGYLYDAQRSLRKLKGWDGVFDIRISGTLLPQRITTAQTAVIYPYPGGVGNVVKWRMVMGMGPRAKVPLAERREWPGELAAAISGAERELKMRVTQGAQVEELPFTYGE